jgi:hypothetical protein
MKGLFVRLLFVSMGIVALAGPASAALNVVTTSAPQINCVFSTTCSVTVTDMSAPIFNGGFVQSRIYQALPGSPAAGNWVYEYRVSLTNSIGILNQNYVSQLIVPFGPVQSYDYNFNGVATDQVFVVTQGGLGNIGLSSAGYLWGWVGFNFASPIYEGNNQSPGDSSYFIGIVSPYPPHVVTGTLSTSAGNINVSVYAPTNP